LLGSQPSASLATSGKKVAKSLTPFLGLDEGISRTYLFKKTVLIKEITS
jgi:hypothetical protein